MKKQILKNAAALIVTAMTALPGLAQHASLVPDQPFAGKTWDYFCTWNIQGYVANYKNDSGTGSPYIRAMMVEDNIFGGNNVYKDNSFKIENTTVNVYDKYKDWASFFPSLHKDLILVLDDSWDIPLDKNGRRPGNANNYGGMAPYGTNILNATRFPSFNKGSATADMKALVDKVTSSEYNYKGLGLWVACNVPEGQNDEKYWKERLKELGDAGVNYLKVDWDINNTQERNIPYRQNLTDWALNINKNLILEHGTFQKNGNDDGILQVIEKSEVVRTYDVTNERAEAETINRIARILQRNLKPYKNGWGVINCEDEPYIAAGLGCAIGIMRHPLVGNLPNGSADNYFEEKANGRMIKHRLNEIVRAVHWHRIAQPFGINGEECHFSLKADGTMAEMSEGGSTTYNTVSRGIALPSYTDADNTGGSGISGAAVSFNDDGTTKAADFGSRPFILASHYPSGATAIAAINRYKDNIYNKIGINVTVQPPTNQEPVGIFGYYNNLTIKYKDGLPTGTVKVWAQDLADDEGTPTDITDQVTLNLADGSLVIKGTTINDLCRKNKYPYDEVKKRKGMENLDYTDVSDPAIVLKVEGTGSLNVIGDKMEAENAEQYNRGDKTTYPISQPIQTGDNNECSGGKYVKWLAYGNQLNFNYNAKNKGTYTLNIYYLSNGNRTLDVYVNGKKTALSAEQLPQSADLNTGAPSVASLDVLLVSGNNTISLSNLTGESPNIDCISLQAKDVVAEPTAARSYYIKNKGQSKYIKTGGKNKTPDVPSLVDNDNDRTAEVFTKAADDTYTIADPEYTPNGWGIQGRNTIYESNDGSEKTNSWGTTLIPGFKLVDTGDGDNSYYIEYTWGEWTKGSIDLDDPSNKTYIVTYGKYDQSTANWTKDQDGVANPLVFGGKIENANSFGNDAKWYLEPADGYSDLTTFNKDGKTIPKYVQVTLNSDESTYSSDKALDFSNVDGLKAYIATGIKDNTNIVNMEEVDAVPANTGLYLKGEAGKTYEVPVANEHSVPAGNLLQPAIGYTRVYPATDEGVHSYDGAAESLYNLMLQYSAEKGYYFIRFTYPQTFGPNRAYMQLGKDYFNDTTSSAKQFIISFGDDATGISTISTDKAANRDADASTVYDLQGRRVSGKPQHGLYIKGGKKFVAK